MGIITGDEQKLIFDCIDFLQPYEGFMQGHYNDFTSFSVSMDATNKAKWLDTFYPALVKSDIILDNRFFCPNGSQKSCGVGDNGEMTVYAYCNIMYRLFRAAIRSNERIADEHLPVSQCIRMLEPYVAFFMNQRNSKSPVKLSKEHMVRWKDSFYPELVVTHIIPDTTFFDSSEAEKNYGIGQDGRFFGAELLHFLYECYKYLGRGWGLWA